METSTQIHDYDSILSSRFDDDLSVRLLEGLPLVAAGFGVALIAFYVRKRRQKF